MKAIKRKMTMIAGEEPFLKMQDLPTATGQSMKRKTIKTKEKKWLWPCMLCGAEATNMKKHLEGHELPKPQECECKCHNKYEVNTREHCRNCSPKPTKVEKLIEEIEMRGITITMEDISYFPCIESGTWKRFKKEINKLKLSH